MSQSKQVQSDIWTVKIKSWLDDCFETSEENQVTENEKEESSLDSESSTVNRLLESWIDKLASDVETTFDQESNQESWQQSKRELENSWQGRLAKKFEAALARNDNAKRTIISNNFPIDLGLSVHAIDGVQAVSPNLLLFDTRRRLRLA